MPILNIWIEVQGGFKDCSKSRWYELLPFVSEVICSLEPAFQHLTRRKDTEILGKVQFENDYQVENT